jgi:5-methylthioribose kinase
MRALFEDALSFAGAAMIRRTLGLAHNIDMEQIADPDLRASCERRNLTLARDLVVNAAGYADIQAVTARAREIETGAVAEGG